MYGTIKTILRKAVQPFGYSLIENWRIQDVAYAAFLRKLFQYLEINCVLDVGANKGQFRNFLRYDVGYSELIISFEPISAHARLLSDLSVADPRWVIHECALGAREGVAVFNVMEETEFSSFLQPDHTVVDRFKKQNSIHKSVEVDVLTLDSVMVDIEKSYGRRNFYLKMDTQGYDLQVVAGVKQNIHLIRGMQTEASVIPIYKNMPDYSSAIRTLQGLGFDVAGIFPVSPENFPLLVEFDCVLVNKSFITNLNKN